MAGNLQSRLCGSGLEWRQLFCTTLPFPANAPLGLVFVCDLSVCWCGWRWNRTENGPCICPDSQIRRHLDLDWERVHRSAICLVRKWKKQERVLCRVLAAENRHWELHSRTQNGLIVTTTKPTAAKIYRFKTCNVMTIELAIREEG